MINFKTTASFSAVNLIMHHSLQSRFRTSILFFLMHNNGNALGWFVCLGSATAFFPRVNSQRRTYGDHPLPPRPLVTPGSCLSLCSLSPHTFVMNASCIRSVPSPVLLSYTYTLSSLWSVSSLFFCPTHIFKPHRKEPLNKHQTPHTNCVNSLFQ